MLLDGSCGLFLVNLGLIFVNLGSFLVNLGFFDCFPKQMVPGNLASLCVILEGFLLVLLVIFSV